jgi:CheY-like chemotaxis protein
VAHDFNNLLTAILGYCELLLDDLSPADPRHADIAEVQKAGVRAAGLTRQLLAFSRKQVIEPTVFDLNGLLTDVRRMLERVIGEDVKIDVRPSATPAMIKADRGQIEQVILNLAVNARDAMPHGGRLTLETDTVELDELYATQHFAVTPGTYVALSVSDTGAGMSAEVQRRLFEPFFTTKPQGKGTGLGLATIHGIVSRCGGSVHVYSEVGTGSVFKVYVPAVNASGGIPVTASVSQDEQRGRETVLLVEDAEPLRLLTTRLLERLGYVVLPATGGPEALRLFDAHPAIDVVLTDVIMPGQSGPELVKLLRERQPDLKVLYMSGYTADAIAHHGVLNPGVVLLNKPFTSELLARKLRAVLTGTSEPA